MVLTPGVLMMLTPGVLMMLTPGVLMLLTPGVLMMLTPVVPNVPPGCTFPPEYGGTWQGTGRGEPRVHINSTHIVTSRYRGPREVQVVHVCIQNRGKRYLLAAVPDNGCDVEYVCWEMLPRHHNIVRYRNGRHSNIPSFEACDHRAFGSGQHWKYDTLIADPPDPVACPVKGRFSVVQEGSMPFVPRVLGGVTAAPLDTYTCKHRSPVWTVCDSRGYGANAIVLDLDACTDLDSWGNPFAVKEVPDYEMLCAGHWQENLRSYLVTFSASDPVSRYRCWVYRRMSLEEVRLSAAVGSACGLHQTHLSSWYNESAQVALTLKLEERMHDQCPMEFDLGRNPWATDHRLRSLPVVFSFTNNRGDRNVFCSSYSLLVIATSAVLLLY
ncbi:hypothetical protein FHG87_001132 [Trinorchestia longiramus]|nr:hypothetical protein FHG87_001132 [Trinorchestia longiramus]